MRFSPFLLLAPFLFVAAPLFATPAAAWDRTPRACEDQGVLHKIAGKFRYQVHHVPHLPDVGIVDFHNITQTRFIAYEGEDQPVARRYCGATAILSDGRRRPMFYLIEDGLGLAGIGDNVEFCVSGFDRWKVYNGGCRVLR